MWNSSLNAAMKLDRNCATTELFSDKRMAVFYFFEERRLLLCKRESNVIDACVPHRPKTKRTFNIRSPCPVCAPEVCEVGPAVRVRSPLLPIPSPPGDCRGRPFRNSLTEIQTYGGDDLFCRLPTAGRDVSRLTSTFFSPECKAAGSGSSVSANW